MNYVAEKHHRRSVRLKEYDYSQPGAYFVTVCSWNRECVFGNIANGEMELNEYGRMIEKEWIQTGNVRTNVEIDKYIVMPNHFHGILIINENNNHPVGARRRLALYLDFK
jgi:putative transposase